MPARSLMGYHNLHKGFVNSLKPFQKAHGTKIIKAKSGVMVLPSEKTTRVTERKKERKRTRI